MLEKKVVIGFDEAVNKAVSPDNEELIHKKLEFLKGDKLFYTLAQEMKSFITSSEPDADFISE